MSAELAVIEPRRELVLSPVMDLDLAKSRMEQFQQFVAHYLQPSEDGGTDGGDYGAIPGAGQKKVLLKSGADKLCELYGIYDEYIVESQEDFATCLFYYKITCILKSRRDDSTLGTGLGSCSTYESKYRWRDSQRACPKCKAQVIIKGKDEFGGGWVCWAKKGGCGAKYKDGDQAIESQKIDRVENPDIMDTVNTVLKMAKKRAKIDAVIGVTRSSGIFTQDLEDVPMPPAKPEVARTTEDIPLKPKSAAGNKAQSGGESAKGNGAPAQVAEAEALATAIVAKLPTVTASPNYITVEEQKEFHATCRKAFSPDPVRRSEADGHTYQWLLDNGYLNDKGEPSASVIPAKDWPKARDKAAKWISVQ